jgi:hypothetical protein
MDAEVKELLEQLKLVTKELALQIASKYQEITLEQIEKGNPIVRDAINIIEKYEER